MNVYKVKLKEKSTRRFLDRYIAAPNFAKAELVANEAHSGLDIIEITCLGSCDVYSSLFEPALAVGMVDTKGIKK